MLGGHGATSRDENPVILREIGHGNRNLRDIVSTTTSEGGE